MDQIINIPFLISFPSGGEWIIVLVVILLLFGAKRLPELARGLGKGIREFKGAVKDVEDELEDAAKSVSETVDEEKPESD
jgi:sec-independent protein translocase protein TatA